MEDNVGLMNNPWLAFGGLALLMLGMFLFLYWLNNKDEWMASRDLKRLKKDLKRER